jgi:HSP20 family protein
MSMEQWDPFRQAMSLRDVMDRLLEESFVRPSLGRRGTGGESLAVDVRENEDQYVVEASLPGVKPEDVQIQVTGDTVTIRGETREEREQRRGENVLMRERRMGSFSRSLRLPMPINAERAEAHFEHGVLTLTLPKAEQARPRRIEVRTGGRQTTENIPVEGTVQSQPSAQGQGMQAGMQGAQGMQGQEGVQEQAGTPHH